MDVTPTLENLPNLFCNCKNVEEGGEGGGGGESRGNGEEEGGRKERRKENPGPRSLGEMSV